MIVRTHAPRRICLLAVFLCAAPAFAQDKLKTDVQQIPGTDVKFELVQLPAGQVTLKDKDGKDAVYPIKPVWIGVTEVTWNVYYVYHYRMDLPEPQRNPKFDAENRPSNPDGSPDRGWGVDGFPAGSIHPKEAIKFCTWLSKVTGRKYRLATEAEWEYACRAGGGPVKPAGKDLKAIAWYEGNSPDTTQAVAKKKANAWGLYDMLGNVAEWVSRSDGTLTTAGGGYCDPADSVHSGARADFTPEWQRNDPQDPKGHSWMSNGAHVGLRIVRED